MGVSCSTWNILHASLGGDSPDTANAGISSEVSFIPLKKPSPTQVRIINPAVGGSLTTSMRSALEQKARGHMVFVSEFAVRRLNDDEMLQSRAVRSEMERERQAWADIARERGGEDVVFEWRGTKVRAPGAGSYAARESGYSVMGARVIATER